MASLSLSTCANARLACVPVHHGSVHLGSVHLCSVHHGSAHLGFVRLGSVHHGSGCWCWCSGPARAHKDKDKLISNQRRQIDAGPCLAASCVTYLVLVAVLAVNWSLTPLEVLALFDNKSQRTRTVSDMLSAAPDRHGTRNVPVHRGSVHLGSVRLGSVHHGFVHPCSGCCC